MAHFTHITIAEMRDLLRPSNGWIELSPEQLAKMGTSFSPVKEHVFDWPIKGCKQPLRVMTSISTGTGMTRDVGTDAIRVFVPLIRKATRVHRVEGWRENLVTAVREMIASVKENPIPQSTLVADLVVPVPKATYQGILDLFAKAKESKLKRPSIRFDVDGQTVQFHVAGPASKYVGQIIVSDGGPFGASKFFGAIDGTGVWTQSKYITSQIASIVSGFNTDPKGFAAAYGKKSGQCCFCHKVLLTAESLHVGYGPVCADKFGLPWGAVEEVA